MKADELRRMQENELRERVAENYRELFNLRFQKVAGKLTNNARPREVRREIARIKTILRERELDAELAGE